MKKKIEPTPKVSNNDSVRIRLRAKIEASRISRLKRDDQDRILEEYKHKERSSKGIEKEKLKILIEVLEEKQRQADEDYENMSYAEYSVGGDNGGGGDGRDNG